jgi:hypothetical protein
MSTLAEVLRGTRDRVQDLPSGAKCVYFYGMALSEYWHLSDYAVSSRSSGDYLILVPRSNPNAGAVQAYPAGRWTGGEK